MNHLSPQTSKGPADWFMGDVYPTILAIGDSPSKVRMGSVHFTPCARTAWHSHAVGQYLYITEGTAYVQERDSEKVVLKPGDVIYTAPGVEHWHGASPDSFMVHLAIWESSEGDEPETVWGEHVTDEEYSRK